MPEIVFLTGAPGSGKSTLARLVADERPLALVLDLDVLRGQLGRWRAEPRAAGLRARQLGLATAATQLEAGGDVIVPQFVMRPELIEQFRRLADRTGSRFTLVALVSSPQDAAARFSARSSSDAATHRAAQFLQEAPGAEPVDVLYTAMMEMLSAFAEARYVETVDGDIEGTLAAVREALSGPGRYPAPGTAT
jgi:predicted kinase